MTQVHKETLTIIENALPNRSGLDIEIFGMEGIPDEVAQSHNQRVLQQFAQAEAERRAATGNLGPAGAAGTPKKPKFEAPSDLKKRLAEHKAKKAAEDVTGIGSGGNTPSGLAQGNRSPGLGQSPGSYVSLVQILSDSVILIDIDKAGSPGFPAQQQQMPFGGTPQNSSYSAFPQPYGQQQPPFQQSQSPFSPQQQAFGPPPNQGFGPPQQFPPQGGPGFQPQFQNGPPPQFQNGPPTSTFQNGPPQFQNGPPNQFQNGPPPFQNGPPPQFQSGPPNIQSGPYSGSPPPFQQNQFQPPQNHTPLQNTIPQRPGSLPPAPGLPQRPSFGAPPVNAFQMQQMHQGQLLGPPNPTDHSHNVQQQQNLNGGLGVPGSLPAAPPSANATSLDELVSGAAKDADRATNAGEAKPELPKAEIPAEEKKGKKEKDKNMKLIYSDNEVSPEEKMAQMSRYAFAPSGL